MPNRTSPGSPPTALGAILPKVALVALGLVVASCYWPGLNGGFVFDDFVNIVDNVALRVTWHSSWSQWLAAMFSSPSSDLQRPLAMLSFAINQLFTGMDPFWIKLTNVGIHIGNTVLVFGLARQLLAAADGGSNPGAERIDWPALWIAAAWALNPINVMAVLFAVQRMESLSHTFVFGGLWLYLVGRRRLIEDGAGWPTLLAGVVGGAGLGLLVKESAALLPVYALIIEGCLLRFASRGRSRDGRFLALFACTVLLPAVAGLAWLLPRVGAAGAYASRGFSLGERLLTEPGVVLHYLWWTVWPALGQMGLFHDDYPVARGILAPPSTLAGIVVLASVAAATLALRRRRPLVALGLGWFLSAHLLTATIIPLDLMYEHRNYFASLGLCIALGDLLLRLPEAPQLRRACLAVAWLALLGFGAVTVLRANEWRDPLRFAQAEAARHPRSPRAMYGLGRQLVLLSEYRADSPYAHQARATLEQAMRLPDASILPETALLFLASRSSQPIDDAWWASMQAKLRDRPIGPQDTMALASLVGCAMKGECPLPQREMVATFDAARQQGPVAEISNIYGNYALNVLREPHLALSLWKEAATLAPRVVEYQSTMARLLIAEGRYNEAVPYIARVRRLGRLGQYESLARTLEQMRARAKARGQATAAPREARLGR